MGSPRIVLSGRCPELQGLAWESEDRLRIGRLGNDLEIVLNHPSISRRHAEVFATPQGWVVRDLGSVNGTLVNGVKVGSSARKLRAQDLLQCGKLALQVGFVQEESVPAVPAAPVAPPAASPRPASNTAPARLVPPGDPSANLRTSGSLVRVQVTAKHSWEEALETVALHQAQRPTQGKHLLTLLRTGHHLCHISSLEELLHSILDDAIQALDAQRGAIVLEDETTGQLRMAATATASGRPTSSQRPFSKTLADRCFHHGTSLLCANAAADDRVNGSTSVHQGEMSSIICALLRTPRRRVGVLHLDRGPLQVPFTSDDLYLADAVAASVAVGIESAQLVARQRDQFVQTVTALARAVEIRDQYTSNHTQRVTDYALMLADEMKVPGAEKHLIQVGTALHDIGKIGIDDSILRKPGKLTNDEFEVMKTHTVKGAAILETIPALWPMIPIARHHHERWDGRGYPDALYTDRIPRSARIVAVADAFDAMTSDRPYRPAMPLDKAFAELQDKAGAHFDPMAVRAFLNLRKKIELMLAEQTPPSRLYETMASGQVLQAKAGMVTP